jgi:transposase
MQIQLNATEWNELEQAQRQERRVRQWRRYQAIRLVAHGQSPQEVATAVGCRLSSVYSWVAIWKKAGRAGLVEPRHGGRSLRMDAEELRQLEALLATDPHERDEQATDWTVPLLRTHLSRAGYELSEHTLRRTLHRLGWRWKRPRYELGRPDPAYAEKKSGCGADEPRPGGGRRDLDGRRDDATGVPALAGALGQAR